MSSLIGTRQPAPADPGPPELPHDQPAAARPRRRRATVVVGVVLVAALVGAGLWIWLRPTPVAPGIMFVGDSVTVMSAPELIQQIGNRHPAVLARVGYRSTDLLPLFAQAVAHRERDHEPMQQVAVLVGYNDVLRNQVESPALDSMMALSNRFGCAVWLTLPAVPVHERFTDRWNQRVIALARSYRHVHVVDDWREAVMSARIGILVNTRDGVHPTPLGAQRLVEIYTNAIHRVC